MSGKYIVCITPRIPMVTGITESNWLNQIDTTITKTSGNIRLPSLLIGYLPAAETAPARNNSTPEREPDGEPADELLPHPDLYNITFVLFDALDAQVLPYKHRH